MPTDGDHKSPQGLMSAIQDVLAQYDVNQARVVLEVFEEGDNNGGDGDRNVQILLEKRNAPRRTASATNDRQIASPDKVDKGTAVTPKHQTSTSTTTTTTTSTSKPNMPSLLEQMEKMTADSPPQTPPPQQPVPRPQSHSERRTHMSTPRASEESRTAPAEDNEGKTSTIASSKTTTTTTTRTTTTTAVPASTATKLSPTPPAGKKPATSADVESLNDTIETLGTTARPDGEPTPTTTVEVEDVTPIGGGGSSVDADMMGQLQHMMGGAAGGMDPNALMPDDLKKQLAMQQDRKERIRILNTFVGKSVLLDNKKQRDQDKRPDNAQFLSAVGKPAKKDSLPTLSPKADGKPANTTTVTKPTATANAKTGATAINPVSQAAAGSGDGSFPSINPVAGNRAPLPNSYAQSCRNNAKTAAALPKSGLTESYSKDLEVEAMKAPAPNSPPKTTLKEMLASQREMERKNQAEMKKHAAIMDEARKFLLEAEKDPDLKPTVDQMRNPLAKKRDEEFAKQQQQPAPPTAPKPASRPVGRATESPSHASPTSPNASRSGSIQVTKFTLPKESQAKDSVVAQLSKSPAGAQHLNNKDRYRALLAEQKNHLETQEEREKDYKKLVEMAVEYNKTLNIK